MVVIPPSNSDYKQSSVNGKLIDFNIPTSSYAIDTVNSVFEYTA